MARRFFPTKESLKSLRHGWWGNTWREWGRIVLAFTGLYLILSGLFIACLYSALAIRNGQFLSLPVRWFGPFVRSRLPIRSTSQYAYNLLSFFNPPVECTELFNTIDTDSGLLQTSSGLQKCTNAKKHGTTMYPWSLYPWTLDSAGLGSYPGCQTDCTGANSSSFPNSCAQEALTAFIARTTSPAYFAESNVPMFNPFYDTNVTTLVCQNNIPYNSFTPPGFLVAQLNITSLRNPSQVSLIQSQGKRLNFASGPL